MSQFYYATPLSNNIARTDEGFLICKNVAITRAGDFYYKDSEVGVAPDKNGLVRMIRTIEEITSPATIASFEGKPVTLQHPDEQVTPENYSSVTVGTLKNVRQGLDEDMDKLIGDVLVMEQEAIEQVLSGETREVSIGFTSEEIEISPGVGLQENIRGNHLAIVTAGRAGHQFAIKDAAIEKSTNVERKMSFKEKVLSLLISDSREDAADTAEANDTKDNQANDAMNKRIGAIEKAVKDMADMLRKDRKDEDMEEEEESSDKKGKKDKKDSKMTIDADTLSRAEILAPGVSEDEDMEMESLRQAYKDAGTKVIIDSLLGGRHFGEMRGDSALRHVVFVGASEIVRAQRGSPVSSLAGRYVSDGINAGKTPEVMTSSKYGQILKAAWKK